MRRLPDESAPPRTRALQSPRQKMGVIPGLMVEILLDARQPLSWSAIHRNVEAILDGPVATSTTKDGLRRMAEDPASPVRRVARGLYSLRYNRQRYVRSDLPVREEPAVVYFDAVSSASTFAIRSS